MPQTNPINIGNNAAVGEILRQRVYTRVKWDDDWTHRPEAHCTHVTWAAAPSLNEAEIYYRYGIGRFFDDEQFENYLPFTLPFLGYVLVQFEVYDFSSDEPNARTTISWTGVVGMVSDNADGGFAADLDGVQQQSGKQRFRCVGFKWLLDRHYVRDARIDGGFISHAPDFAQNKLADDLKFDRKFEHSSTSDPWTTVDVIDYLLQEQTPRGSSGGTLLPFKLVNRDVLPDWDAVKMAQHGHTTGALLNRLISRHRGLSYFIDVDLDSNDVELKVFTFATSEVDLGSGRSIKENPFDRHELTVAADGTGQLVQVTDSFARYNRVRAVGERATVTFTSDVFRIHDDVDIDEKIDAALMGINPDDVEQSQHLIGRVLDDPDVIRAATHWRVNIDGFAYAPDDNGGMASEPTYPEDKYILSRTRLVVGEDYEGQSFAAAPDSDTREAFEVPFLTIEAPSGERIDTRFIANTAREGYDFNLQLQPGDSWQSFYINARQVVLDLVRDAAADYSDQLRALNNGNEIWNFEDMQATVTMLMDHYCESVVEGDIDPNQDVVLEKLIVVGGDRYRLDLIDADTIVGVRGGEAIVHSTRDWIRDDRPELESIAKTALTWYGTDRKSITFGTNWLNGQLLVGTIVESLRVGEGDSGLVNISSPITETSISWPVTQGTERIPLPSIRYQTSFAELDVVELYLG